MGNSYKWEAKKISDLYTDVNIAEQAIKSDVNKQPDFVTYKEPKSLYHSEHSPFGYMPGSDENVGSLDRWREYRKMLKEKYPLVRGSAMKNAWKLPLYYAGNKISKHFSENVFPEASRNDAFSIVAGGISDSMEINFKHQFGTGMYHTFPRIRVFSAFSDDSTVIEKVYTTEVVHNGITYEIPAFLRKQKEDKPDDAILTRNVNFIHNHKVSPYNKIDNVSKNFIEPYFNRFGIEKYSRGDFERYFQDEPNKFYRWLTKDSTYNITQYGQRNAADEAALPPALIGQIKVYDSRTDTSGFWYRLGQVMGDDSPSSWNSLWYWQIGDWVYDAVDLIFGPAEAILRKSNVPKPAIRNIMDNEYKVHAAARRNIFPGAGINFTYEVPGLSANAIRRSTEEARSYGYG